MDPAYLFPHSLFLGFLPDYYPVSHKPLLLFPIIAYQPIFHNRFSLTAVLKINPSFSAVSFPRYVYETFYRPITVPPTLRIGCFTAFLLPSKLKFSLMAERHMQSIEKFSFLKPV